MRLAAIVVVLLLLVLGLSTPSRAVDCRMSTQQYYQVATHIDGPLVLIERSYHKVSMPDSDAVFSVEVVKRDVVMSIHTIELSPGTKVRPDEIDRPVIGINTDAPLSFVSPLAKSIVPLTGPKIHMAAALGEVGFDDLNSTLRELDMFVALNTH